MRLIRLLFLCIIANVCARAQESEVAHVRTIIVTGNRITKLYIVKREIGITEGTSYPMSLLLHGIEKSRQNLMNTGLFVDVSLCLSPVGSDSLDVVVDLKERWYFMLFPYLNPIDRNLNVWVNEYDMDPSRVNYGIKFHGKNITGRNDKLNAWIINGYTQRLAMNYYNPFSNNALNRGWGFEVAYARNRELNLSTSGNRQQFFKDPSRFVRQQFYAGGTYSYRKGSINRHYVKLGIMSESVADTVVRINPNYLGNGAQKAVFPELRYRFQHFDVDYIPYPTKGTTVEAEFLKRGFGGNVDLSQFTVSAARYWSLGPRGYWASSAEFHLRVPFDQPFFNRFMLGYRESYLRGLEYYVVDGLAGGFNRNTVAWEFLNLKWKTGLRSRSHAVIPFRFYAKIYGDAGYVYNRSYGNDNPLDNRFLYTGGFGIDVVSIYDAVLRLEFSFNQLGQQGFFFHKPDIRN